MTLITLITEHAHFCTLFLLVDDTSPAGCELITAALKAAWHCDPGMRAWRELVPARTSEGYEWVHFSRDAATAIKCAAAARGAS